jgi:hypothetical protein
MRIRLCARLPKLEADLVKPSVLYKEWLVAQEEFLRFEEIESERAGYDIGFERALLLWIVEYRSAWRAWRDFDRKQNAGRVSLGASSKI